jgi:TonB-dependent SusC/RagA subfamily outer membrane receptor
VVNSATHDVSLQLDNTLDEVVVAYGTQSKKSLTGSVGIVSSEAIEIVRNPNVVQGVTGKVAGVQVINDSGQPGEEPTVRIRGLGSLYSEAGPLYFVDGVPFNRDVSSISNNDIASMTILKDAAAGALYGHRGANGVVIITTKKGRKGGINNAPAGNYSITVTHKGDLQGVDGNPFQQFDLAFSVILSGENLTLSSSSLVREIGDAVYVYPNPIKSRAFIELYDNQSGDFIDEVFVYDLSGKLLLHNVVENTNKHVVLFENFKSGAYIISVSLNGVTLHNKLVFKK